MDRLTPPGARDVAAVAEEGPSPLRRAAHAILIGLGAGIVAALLTPRPDRSHAGARPAEP